METRNARIGMRLFLFYALFYAAFVLTNAFAPTVMEVTPFAGVNLAILSGFGLILLALIVALVYGYVARNVHSDISKETISTDDISKSGTEGQS